MLRSLNISLILLSICTCVLTGLTAYLLLEEINPDPAEAYHESIVPAKEPDPSSMDSATYSRYMKMKEGEKLFKDNGCSSCHEVAKKKVGPALAGVTQRRNRAWIYSAITNFAGLMAKQDPTALDLFKEYNMQMPTQDFLKKEEIDKILYFVEASQSKDYSPTAMK